MSNTRSHTIGTPQRRSADGGDLVVDMAFASQAPYERWWGIEVLDVSAKAVRLQRLNDGAPLLFNHDWNDLRGTHVPGSVRADSDGVLRGQVRITSATQAGRDAIALVDSQVLTKASVGYQIHKVIEISTKKTGEKVERAMDGATFERLIHDHAITRDGRPSGGDAVAFRRAFDEAAGGPVDRADDTPPVYRVTDWEPLENSLVTVPADNGVGVGRGLQQVSATAERSAIHPEKATMAETQAAAGAIAEQETGVQTRGASLPAQPAGTTGNRALELENARQRGITNLCKANSIPEATRNMWISSGSDFDTVSEELLQILESRGKNTPKITELGLSEGEAKRFSLFKAVRAASSKGNWAEAGFELECSREIAKRLQRIPEENKFFVPFEVQGVRSAGQRRSLSGWTDAQRRDLTSGTANAGGYLVGTENMSFIEMLRNRSVAYRMGARRLSGLQGNITVPRQTAAATAVWLSNEASTATESQQTFGQMALSPKTVGAYTEISRQLLLQSSPDAEALTTADLGSVCALAVDVGVLRGSGASGEPTGIVNTAGIGSVTGTSIAYAGILEFQTDVATANVMPAAGGYVTTPAVAALAMQRVKFSSTASPLWEGNVWDGSMAGFPAMSTNQMTAASMLFGDWSQVVVAEWGVLEIEVNPYANFQAGIIGIRAMVSVDVGLRYAAAFSLATSIT